MSGFERLLLMERLRDISGSLIKRIGEGNITIGV